MADPANKVTKSDVLCMKIKPCYLRLLAVSGAILL